MSYVIHIWDRPSPVSWDEAQAIFHRLSGQAAAPNPRFVELARQVQARWPALASDWTLDAPDGLVDEAVWSLGLVAGLPDDFYPRLVDQAVLLGLSVYDEQAGECFTPGPWRLSASGRERLAWLAVANAPAEAALLDVQGRFRALVLPRLAPLGFGLELPPPRGNLLQTRLTRATPLGLQSIDVEWKGEATSHYDATVFCRIVPELPQAVATLCAPQTRITFEVIDTPQLNAFLYGYMPARPKSREYRASGPARLDELLLALAEWLLHAMVPILDACRSVEAFLAYDLEEPRQPIYVKAYLVNLALAYCAGAPDLDERVSQWMQRRAQDGMNVDQLTRAREALQTQAGDVFGSFNRSTV